MKQQSKATGIVFMLILILLVATSPACGCTWWTMLAGEDQDIAYNVLYEQLLLFRTSGSQPHGWAYVGYARQNNLPLWEYRSKRAAANDPQFPYELKELYKKRPMITIMHNWMRVTGPEGIVNPYPHVRTKHGKRYALGDNGVTDMEKLFKAVAKDFLAKNPIRHGESIDNYQMGELWLLLILQEIENNNGNSEVGFVRAIQKMGNSINASLVFSDGFKIYCYTDNRGLYYYHDSQTSFTIVSSGATAGKEIHWKRLNGGQRLLFLEHGAKPRIVTIQSYK